jgi:hypothetical protein
MRKLLKTACAERKTKSIVNNSNDIHILFVQAVTAEISHFPVKRLVTNARQRRSGRELATPERVIVLSPVSDF